MQVSLGGTGIWLSDGATNVMPVGPHRAEEGASRAPQQISENRAVVHRATAYDTAKHQRFMQRTTIGGDAPTVPQ